MTSTPTAPPTDKQEQILDELVQIRRAANTIMGIMMFTVAVSLLSLIIAWANAGS